MTEGRPWKLILSFTLPLILGNFAQQLYNAVDSMVVGQYIGDNALSAVGVSIPILFVLTVLFIDLSTGASIMVRQYVCVFCVTVGFKNFENAGYYLQGCTYLFKDRIAWNSGYCLLQYSFRNFAKIRGFCICSILFDSFYRNQHYFRFNLCKIFVLGCSRSGNCHCCCIRYFSNSMFFKIKAHEGSIFF